RLFFFSSRRRHTRFSRDWSSDVCSSDLGTDSMGETAENVAAKYGVTREDQDAFALRSQQKAAAARLSGRHAEEITTVLIPQKKEIGRASCRERAEERGEGEAGR